MATTFAKPLEVSSSMSKMGQGPIKAASKAGAGAAAIKGKTTSTRAFGRSLANMDISQRGAAGASGKDAPAKKGGAKPAAVEKPKPSKPAASKPRAATGAPPVELAALPPVPLASSVFDPASEIVESEQTAGAPFEMDLEDLCDLEGMSIEDNLASTSLEDIDFYNKGEPIFVTDYVNEIFSYLKEKEVTDAIPHDYMSNQKELMPRHRDLLVDWMQEVYFAMNLLSETLFLAVNIVDRVLSIRPVSKRKLQLVAAGAILVAAKFEELWAPLIQDMIYTCANAFTREEILLIERVLLNTINFNLSIPTPLYFLRRFSQAAHSDSTTHTLCKFITELTLTSYSLLKYKPSELAASAVYLARRMQHLPSLWNSNLRYYTGYTEEELLPCARDLNEVLIKELANLRPCAIVRKYMEPQLLGVAKIPPIPL